MKKTTKENPITTFRKNFEARSKTVMSSLKKAQNGIAVNDEMSDDLPKINPPPTRVKAKGGPVKYKTGGAAKATKFAALAKPFNKATAADRIAGAKKNARKKK